MPNLGLRIRELRLARGLTLEQVAAQTGLSVSFLSMLERSKVSISVDNLERLANYYQIHMVHFFSADAISPVLVTRAEAIAQTMQDASGGPANVTLLSNAPNPRIEPLLIRIDPGKEEPHFRMHEADMLVYVMQGEACLISEHGEQVELHQGDLAYYVNVPHRRFANARADQPLVILTVAAPPTSTLDDILKARQGTWVMGEQ